MPYYQLLLFYLPLKSKVPNSSLFIEFLWLNDYLFSIIVLFSCIRHFPFNFLRGGKIQPYMRLPISWKICKWCKYITENTSYIYFSCSPSNISFYHVYIVHSCPKLEIVKRWLYSKMTSHKEDFAGRCPCGNTYNLTE